MEQLIRRVLGPLFLMLCCPPAAVLMWYTMVHHQGSFQALWIEMNQNGFFQTLFSVWAPIFWGSKTAWCIIAVHSIVQLTLMRILPGERFEGPVAPSGHVPVYKANGVLAFVVTIAAWFIGGPILHVFKPSIVFDHFGELVGALNVLSLVFCFMLYLKGKFAPSGKDHGLTGNFIFDYYWGTELYPRIFGFDVKMFTNCRFGMMAWPLVLLSFAAAQYDRWQTVSTSMVVAVALQFVYLAKFYIWETGYLRSLDIMHDRAGFYICWGCLVWVPTVYTSGTLYLVDHPIEWPVAVGLLMFVLGTVFILMNYWADRQRQMVRATQGSVRIWGKEPVLIQAHYVTEAGEAKTNLLLASGFWGLSRHFHYVPEILGAFFWTLPAGFTHAAPWFYVVFLTLLLTDRARRDDLRCAKKYGKDWNTYCEKVPYFIIPKLF